MRGFALVGVILIHIPILTLSHSYTGITDVDLFIRGGYLGLDLFFVLSGFLITALLLGEAGDKGTVRFGAFYTRRALRLLPALYLLLLGYAVYATFSDLDTGNVWPTTRSALLYVTNWQIVFDPSSMSEELIHLWSLAFEEQFYLIWPVTLIALLRLRLDPRALAGVIALTAAGVALWRAWLWEQGVPWPELAIRTDARIDAMLIGALVAVLWTRRRTPIRGIDEAAWVALAVMAWCAYSFDGTEGASYQGGLSLFHVSSAIVVLAVVNGTWGAVRFFEWTPFRALGRYSYGIYLWHHFIFFAVSRNAPGLSGAERVIIALALSAIAATVSWTLVERPALRLKHRFGGQPLTHGVTTGRRPAPRVS